MGIYYPCQAESDGLGWNLWESFEGQINAWFDFGGYLDHCLDPGIVLKGSLTIVIFETGAM